MDKISLLNGVEDNHGGIVVNLMKVKPMTVDKFDSKLDASLKAWKDLGKKGIWIKLPSELSNLVDIAIKKGFTYHHAENEYVMLTYWLPEPPSTLPANASHRIGIGAFVLNKNREIETKFVEVLAFRESHQAVWQIKMDIFFLCELEANTFEIKKQDSEIFAAKVHVPVPAASETSPVAASEPSPVPVPVSVACPPSTVSKREGRKETRKGKKK